MEFLVNGAPRRIDITELVVAGWTGRDKAAVEHHIAELAAIGVKRPRTVPCFYRLGANLLTTAREVEVVGDHTDRKVEAYGVTVSKQMCPKPIGRELWPFAEVEGHWDRLMLRSHATRKGKRRLYQEGAVSGMLTPSDLLERFADSGGKLSPGTAMFCGTLAVRGDIGGGERFEIELHDAVKNRSLSHEYATRSLAIAD